MNRICEKCNGIMNYDPYFKSNVCNCCGNMQRLQSNTVAEIKYQQKNIKAKISYYAKPTFTNTRKPKTFKGTKTITY